MPGIIQHFVVLRKPEKLRAEFAGRRDRFGMPKIKTPNAAASHVKTAFAARLRALRLSLQPPEKAGELTQADFAKLLGLEAETYRRYERGETEPALAVLARIRLVTGASLNSLVAGEIDRAA